MRAMLLLIAGGALTLTTFATGFTCGLLMAGAAYEQNKTEKQKTEGEQA